MKPEVGDYVVTMYGIDSYGPGEGILGTTVEWVLEDKEVMGKLVAYPRPNESQWTKIQRTKRTCRRLRLADRLFYTSGPVRRLTLAEYLALKQVGEIDDDENEAEVETR